VCTALLGCSALLGIGDLPPPAANDGGDASSTGTDDGAIDGSASVTIAQNQAAPVALAVDANNVYWVNAGNGTVVYCPKAGCAGAPRSVTSFASDGANANSFRYGITVDAANVYWFASADQGASELVMQCAIAGCNNAPTRLLSAKSISAIGVGPQSVFIAATGAVADAGISGPGVSECAIGGCAEMATLFASEPKIQSLTVHDGRVYWTAADPAVQNDIMACPTTGCAGSPAVLLAGPFPLAPGIAVGNGNVYALYASGQQELSLIACAVGGCARAPTPLATGISGGLTATPIGADTKEVFFTTYTSAGTMTRASVSACGVGGCSDQPRTAVAPQVDSFVVDDTGIYWVDTKAGKVSKIPRR
jgi:hypothetical protein